MIMFFCGDLMNTACACVTYAQRAPRAACVKWVTRLDVTAGRDTFRRKLGHVSLKLL